VGAVTRSGAWRSNAASISRQHREEMWMGAGATQ
jgi:hypothetical protein